MACSGRCGYLPRPEAREIEKYFNGDEDVHHYPESFPQGIEVLDQQEKTMSQIYHISTKKALKLADKLLK